MKEVRPRMSEQEYELYRSFREQHKALIDECEKNGVPASEVTHYWHKSERFSMFVKPKGVSLSTLKYELIKDVKLHSPLYPEIIYPENNDPHLLVIDPADVHLGKLCSSFETGEEYNNQIAVKRVNEGVA